MWKTCTAPARHPLFFVPLCFLLLSPVASPEVVVHPDGSATIETVPMSTSSGFRKSIPSQAARRR